VKRYHLSRQDQDALAAGSQRRANDAVSSGIFDREIVEVEVPQRKGPPQRVSRDEYPRPGTTAETLAALRPAAGDGDDRGSGGWRIGAPGLERRSFNRRAQIDPR
jgi:acetyl-CoA acetyltransferase